MRANPTDRLLLLLLLSAQLTPFEGPHADVVNAVRLGDHIDAR